MQVQDNFVMYYLVLGFLIVLLFGFFNYVSCIRMFKNYQVYSVCVLCVLAHVYISMHV